MEKREIKQIISICLLVMVILGTLLFRIDKEYLLAGNKITLLNQTYHGTKATVNKRLDLEKNTPYTLTVVIPDDFTPDKKLLIRSSLATVKVHFNKSLIYSDQLETKPLASLWHVIELPRNSAGQTIHLTFQSPYQRMNGIVNPVYLGQQGDLAYHIIAKYGLAFLVDSIILLIGLALIMIAFIHSKDVYNNVWYIGMFALFLSSWLLAESKMLQFFTGSQLLIGSLAYISLPLIPIPLLRYIQRISIKKNPLLDIAGAICFVILLVVISLQVFNIQDFFETLWLTHGFFVVLIALLCYHLYKEIKFQQNSELKLFSFALLVLFLFIIFDLVRFHFLNSKNVTLYVRAGILFFITFLSMRTGKELIALLRKSYHAEYYEKLAYIDQLTQGLNRTAFERDLNKNFSNQHIRKTLRLVILDVNQLKHINDVYGHLSGDDAIQTAYTIIHHHFKFIGHTYRIGGDEFACIITHTTYERYNQIQQAFLNNIREVNQVKEYPFGIAIGSVAYEEDISAKHLMHRADIKMYEFKSKKHGIS